MLKNWFDMKDRKAELVEQVLQSTGKPHCADCGRKLKFRHVSKTYCQETGDLESLYFVFGCRRNQFNEGRRVDLEDNSEFIIFNGANNVTK